MWWDEAKRELMARATELHRWKANDLAQVIEQVLARVDEARSSWLSRIVSTDEGERITGRSKAHLERLIRDGELPDLRRRGRGPHVVRIGDLIEKFGQWIEALPEHQGSRTPTTLREAA